MAQVFIEGIDAVGQMFRDLGEIPWEVTVKALDAMAAVAQQKVRASGEAMGVRDPKSQVHILDKITRSKPKQTEGGGRADVTFSGTRTRGNTKTRNAEIAFLNEYGKRGQPARPFIRQAAEQGAEEIAAAGEKIIGDWFKKTAGS